MKGAPIFKLYKERNFYIFSTKYYLIAGRDMLIPYVVESND